MDKHFVWVAKEEAMQALSLLAQHTMVDNKQEEQGDSRHLITPSGIGLFSPCEKVKPVHKPLLAKQQHWTPESLGAVKLGTTLLGYISLDYDHGYM